jgi:hypothetical protein
VSQDYPFREIENHKIGNPDDERLGLSMVEIPGQIWTDQIYEGYVLKDFPHRGTGDQEFGSPVIKSSDSRDDKSR